MAAHRDGSVALSRAGARRLALAMVTILAAGCATDPTSAPDGAVDLPLSEPVVATPEGATGADAARVYSDTADRFARIGDHAAAATHYRRALELDPDAHAARLALARELAVQGLNREAIPVLRDLLSRLQSADDTRELRRVRAGAEGLLLELDELGMALAEAARVITDYGRAAESAGRAENAFELYTRAIALWPGAGEARTRARALAERKGWQPPADPAPAPEPADRAYMDLSDLTPVAAELRGGELRRDETKWGLPIYNGGQTYPRGLWAPAPARLTFALNGRYARFTAKALIGAFKGTDAQTAVLEGELRRPRSGTVVFAVIADGRERFVSDVVTYSSGAVPVDLDLTGVQTLVLETRDADGSSLLDFAVWADGRLALRR